VRLREENQEVSKAEIEMDDSSMDGTMMVGHDAMEKHTTQHFALDVLDVAFPFLAVFAVPELYFEDFAGHG
jgi:hypothetical protein